MKKDVIYIDIEDDITAITEKVQNSNGQIIALVLPKHCSVLQSAVNMKILNKTAKTAHKHVVLITSEASLLPLAAAVKLYVAKTLQSKPYIPDLPVEEEKVATISESTDELPDTNLDATKPIGELATKAVKDDDEPIELGDEVTEDKKDNEPPKKKNRKLKVPNFNKFRIILFLAILGVILLISGGVYAAMAMPKAVVTVTTENKSISYKMTVTASPAAKQVDLTNKVVPAESKTLDHTVTKKFAATGQKDVGNKATGEVVFYNCSKEDKLEDKDRVVPVGTGISDRGLTYITQKEVTVQPSSFIGSVCTKNKPSAKVGVVAQSGGDGYNVGPREYDVAGFASMIAKDTEGMGGGTTKLVTAVSQADCDSAVTDLKNAKTDDYKNQLSARVNSAGLLPIRETFTTAYGDSSCNPSIGTEASESTASLVLKFSMVGLNESAMDQLVNAEVKKQLKNNQSIFDSGIKTASVAVLEKRENGEVVLSFQGEAQTGIKQDSAAVANLIAGKKYGESLQLLKDQSGVSDVKISYSPFWVSGTPKDIKRITVNFINNGSD